MGLTSGLAALCMALLGGLVVMVWMTYSHLRDRHDASIVVPLEVAVCIQKENGDVFIRQRRGKGVLGLVLGLMMVMGGLAMPVTQLLNSASLELEILCLASFLLILGTLVAGVSTRGLREPDVNIKITDQTVEIRYGLLKGTQTWPFAAIVGITGQPLLDEDALFSFVAGVGSTNRVSIGLQHSDGQIIRICTATQEATRQVPDILATAIGKPLLVK